MKKLNSDHQKNTPSEKSIRNYLFYGLSLPERTIRSSAAVVGGVLNESATLLVPQAFRDSRSYQTFVQQMLDLVAKDVGRVGGEQESSESADSEDDESKVENYVARKAVGSFIDFAGMATFHLSPVVMLAVVSDIAYGSNVYLKELSDELKSEGIIPAETTIDQASDLLEAIGKVSGETAGAMDTPPISFDGLQQTISETTESLKQVDPSVLIPRTEIDRLWNDMQDVSNKEGVSLLSLSSAMTLYTLNQVETARKGALTTIRITGDLLDQHVFQHYVDSLVKINEQGVFQLVAESSEPYIEAVWENFSLETETITEEILSGRLFNKILGGLQLAVSKQSEEPTAESSVRGVEQ